MPFPHSSRQSYSKNPIQEVICQIRYPTILDISTRPPADFQNLIRQQFPMFDEGQPAPSGFLEGIPPEIAKLVEGPLTRTALTVPLYKFSTSDHDKTITLTQDFLAFSSNTYDRWENFSAGFQYAEAAFKETYGPAFYSRVGLRYRDFVDRGELGLQEHRWSDLFNPEFIGVLGAGSTGEAVEESRSNALIRLSGLSGVARIQHGFAKRSTDDQIVYSIDADFYKTDKTEIDHVGESLDIFNRCAGDFFRWAISDTLRDALGPTDIEGNA